MSRLIIFSILISLCLPLFSQTFTDDTKDVMCEDTCRHIHGFDISHYQDRINWQAIGDNKKMAFVYIKATEGGDNVDSKYTENICQAKNMGLKVGSYHYFRPKTELIKQLDNFTSQCKANEQDLIPMIDIETKGGLTDEAFRDSLMSFLQMIEEYYRQKPLLYTGTNFYNKYLSDGIIDGYKIMIAQYTDTEPVLNDGREITLWQYTGKGNVEGIKGYIDKSRFVGRHGLREIRFRKRKYN